MFASTVRCAEHCRGTAIGSLLRFAMCVCRVHCAGHSKGTATATGSPVIFAMCVCGRVGRVTDCGVSSGSNPRARF